MNLLVVGLLLCCGAAAAEKVDSKNRIANGANAANSEFPYQVSLQFLSSGFHFCGGALITNSHVLTAAHCVNNIVDSRNPVANFVVEVGTNYKGYGKYHYVKRVSYHSGYAGDQGGWLYPNDIAVVHLLQPVQITSRASPIRLPTANTPLPVGTRLMLSGFGTSYVPGPASPILKKLDLQVVDRDYCDRYFWSKMKFRVPTDKVCATKGVGYGACKGDSGGPLVDATKKTIVGIVSAGDLECSNGYPDIYTDVSQFLTYINEELNYRPGTVSRHRFMNYQYVQSG